MSEQTIEQQSANERFKKSFSGWFWGSMLVATVMHFAVFLWWPDLEAEDVSFTADELEAVEIPPEVEIPPPPEAIARPATPVVAEAVIDDEITIEVNTFESVAVEDLPPPPSEVQTDISAAPTFTPWTVKPAYTNTNEIMRALEREYPALLRDAGIGGTVVVNFFIDEEGVVQNAVVHTSSGHTALDEAALRVAPVFNFTPALNRDKVVPVWVEFPVTFTTR